MKKITDYDIKLWVVCNAEVGGTIVDGEFHWAVQTDKLSMHIARYSAISLEKAYCRMAECIADSETHRILVTKLIHKQA